jgi:deazaflavin-dependent oxidoreductase (nitroreductase family)
VKLYDSIIQNFARSRVGGWMFVNVFNSVDRFLMSTTKARISTGIGSRFNENAVLLGCTGARSGLSRQVPLLATPVDNEFVLIASKAGSPEHPAWYRNLKANPDCTLTAGGRVLRCTAREAEGEERERLWRAAVDNYAGYADYQRRTERRIPVMVLTREAD